MARYQISVRKRRIPRVRVWRKGVNGWFGYRVFGILPGGGDITVGPRCEGWSVALRKRMMWVDAGTRNTSVMEMGRRGRPANKRKITCIVLTSSLSFMAATHAAYLGYSASFSSWPSSFNKPSPTMFQVMKDRSAKVHFLPTNQPVPFLSRATSKTLKTR